MIPQDEKKKHLPKLQTAHESLRTIKTGWSVHLPRVLMRKKKMVRETAKLKHFYLFITLEVAFGLCERKKKKS